MKVCHCMSTRIYTNGVCSECGGRSEVFVCDLDGTPAAQLGAGIKPSNHAAARADLAQLGAGETAVQGDMLLPANVGAKRAAEGGPLERLVRLWPEREGKR